MIASSTRPKASHKSGRSTGPLMLSDKGTPCVYRKLKPGRSDGEARRGWVVNESFRSDESDEKSAHPYAKTDAYWQRNSPLLTPHLVGDLDRKAQLGPLLVLAKDVALLGGGETALRRYRQLLQRREFRRFLQPPLDMVLLFQFADLRGDDADHPDLVALRQKPQRLESAGPIGIVFEEIAVIIGAREHGLRHRLVAAGRNPGRAEIAAADVGGDHHVGRPFRDRVIDHTRINLLKVIGIIAARACLGQFVLRAEVGPHSVVELQIATSHVVERLHRLAIG